MNAKGFFYSSAGILLLVAAYTLGARDAKADWDETLTGPIVGGTEWVFYTANGEAWSVGNPSNPAWTREPAYDLPVPASEVKLLTSATAYGVRGIIITKSGDAWAWANNALPGGNWGWLHVGPFPGGPIQVDGKSWSGVKDGYRQK